MSDRNLFICIKDTKAKANSKLINQPVLIEKGDIVQFRYDSPKHFRTIHEEYFCVSEQLWNTNFVCVGEVWEEIVWNNKATLQEILNLELYKQTREQKELIAQIRNKIKDDEVEE